MPQPLFEAACAVVIVITLWMMSRTRPVRPVLLDYAALAAAGWIGEQTCIRWYRFYAYDDRWSLFAGDVPVLVPLIWPLVILSARDVTTSLWPASGRWSALITGAVVVFDASLVEVVAVRAGLWRWAEPGHLGVPLIGILGWGFFAIGVALALDLRWAWRRGALLVLGPAVAHASILASWWGVFRWTLRGDLGLASVVGVLAIGLAAASAVILARRAGHLVPMSVAGPRMTAALLFLALFAIHAREDWRMWAHVVAVSLAQMASSAVAPLRRVPTRAR